MPIKLGSRVKDTISGLEGIATGRTEYLFGCVRIQVTPQKVKDGAAVEGQWLDEDQLVKAGSFVPARPTAGATGGPMPAPKRAADATR